MGFLLCLHMRVKFILNKTNFLSGVAGMFYYLYLNLSLYSF